MLTRSREILHPSGFKIKTPLLVPSFSSKGFSLHNKIIAGKKVPVSELYDVMLVCKELLTECLLVSSYDLHYSLIPKPSQFNCTEIVFVDSGGYETSNSYDFSGINKTNLPINTWNESALCQTLESWPREYPSIIVNYDHGNVRIPLKKQIENATTLFNKYSATSIGDFLIKPERKTEYLIKIDNVIQSIKKLKDFKIVGVTEKEIGSSILQRMLNISKLRRALDEVNPEIPIHVFGSLDPITSTLYYMAGAEIFDGLTWLKFSYHESLAIYTHNYALVNNEIGIHIEDKHLKIKSLTGNINFLQKLKYVLLDFHKTQDFSVFQEIGGNGYPLILEKAFKRHFNNLK